MKNTYKKSICFYFQLHQPYRLRESSFFEKEGMGNHFDGPTCARNEDVFNKVADKCYIPATNLLLKMLKKHPEFRVSFSVSGVFIEQCEDYNEKGKEVLSLLKQVMETGQAEVLSETYYHSLSFLFSKEEYAEQIRLHSKKVKDVFGVKPKVFRNTELIYNNEISEFIRQMGFKGILAEGWDPHLPAGSPNYLHHARSIMIHEEDYSIARKHAAHKGVEERMHVLLKNYKLSDDIAFRFSQKSWGEHPLFTEKFVHWVDSTDGEVVNLFMDYETLGEHQWEDTGIFEFLEHLPQKMLEKNIGFVTPSEAIEVNEARFEYDVPQYISWADTDRDLSAWLENDIQRSALDELRKLEGEFHPHKKSRKKNMKELVSDFRKLQTSDHLYYMCTKYFNDGDVHKYFSPYDSEHAPYDAYIYFMNTIRHIRARLSEALGDVKVAPVKKETRKPRKVSKTKAKKTKSKSKKVKA